MKCKFYIISLFFVLIKYIISFYPYEQLLTGEIISSDDYFEIKKAPFDNNTSTSFESFYDKCWIGLDLLSENYITKIGFAQNSIHKLNYILGIFEGANTNNFYDAVPLYMIKEEVKLNEINYVEIFTNRPFRYIRYVGPSNRKCIISEIKIYGFSNKLNILHNIYNQENYFYQPTNIPLLIMNTGNLRDYHEYNNFLDCFVYIINDNKIEISGTARRKYRGNGSLIFPKLSYSLKFTEEKKTFLDFPSKSKNWILISNYADKSLIRNLLSQEVSRLFGMKYTINCQPIDYICNGEYLGNYIICEKIEVKRDRINISKIYENSISYPEITGGYLIEIDAYAYTEKSKFISFKNTDVTINYPKEDKILPEQHMYIENKFNQMERKVFKSDLSNIDIDSFVQYFLIQEFCGNADAYWSVKMYKERNDDHFYFGPIWDFDISFDNDVLFYPMNKINKFLFEYANSFKETPKLIEKILIEESVIKKIKYLWKSVYDNKLKNNYMNLYIDELVKKINESQKLNFIRWNILDKIIMGRNPIIKYTFENEIIFLKEFIKERMKWMNINILNDNLYEKYKRNTQKYLKIRYLFMIFIIFVLL